MTRRSSDESAAEWIGPLYDRFAAGLYRYALMVLADPAAASDAVQEVFAGIIDRLPRIDDAEHYLRRAVRNECYSTLRRRRRQDRAIIGGAMDGSRCRTSAGRGHRAGGT